MIVIGLTGSIGMGKSTIAEQFATFGAKLCNSDTIVHGLMAKGGAAVAEIVRYFPDVVKDGAVDRKALGSIVFNDSNKRKLLEQIIHPMVVTEENRFIEEEKAKGTKYVVLDIPLLFETGAETRCDLVVVATAPYFIQRYRVLKRPNMTREKFKNILASQLPDYEKRKRADFVVQTGLGKAYSLRQVEAIIRNINAA